MIKGNHTSPIKRIRGGGPETVTKESSSLDIEQVYRLITARASGRATNEQVEHAVSQLLQQKSSLTTTHKANDDDSNITVIAGDKDLAPQKEEDDNIQVIQDSENYDDDDDDEQTNTKTPPNNAKESESMPPPTTPARSPKLSRQKETDQQAKALVKKLDLSKYEHIPLGDQGAQMMIVFGDGLAPEPTAVAAVLAGTRQSLLCAIQDARHVRRKEIAKMDHARLYNNGYSRVGFDEAKAQEWTADTLIKVQTGFQNRQTPVSSSE